MNTIARRFRPSLITIIFVLGFFSSLLYMLNQKIVPDSIQLLERGHLFMHNQLIPFGPRSSNTNFVYGPFISVFVGLCLSVYDHPMAPLAAILMLHIVGFFFLLRIQFFSSIPNFLPVFIFLYWLSPWRSSEVFLWNPSFLFPLMVMYLYGIDLVIRSKAFLGTLLMVLAAALTFQIHNSFIFLLILSAWIAFRMKIRPHMGALILGSCFGIAALIPTVIVINDHPEILQMNQKSAGLFGNLLSGGEALKGVLYWFRYPSLYFGSTTFQLPTVQWSDADLWSKSWKIIKWVLAIISLVFVAMANVNFFKKAKGTFIWELAMGGFVALVWVSAMSPVPFNFWHLYLIYPLTIIPIAWVVSKTKQRPVVFLCLGLYFVVYAGISAFHSYKHEYGSLQYESYNRLVKLKHREIRDRFALFSLKMGNSEHPSQNAQE